MGSIVYGAASVLFIWDGNYKIVKRAISHE